jgi:hypothetical protein
MYQRMCQTARALAIVLVASALAACDIAVNGEGGFGFNLGAQAQDEWTRSYDLSAGGRFELINVNGRITAEPSTGNRLEVKAERIGKGTTDEAAKEALARLEMREEVGDNRVRVEVRAPRLSTGSGHEIRWTVRVPQGVAVDLRTTNGGVELTRLEGDVRARTTNGGIKGFALNSSNVDAAVTNGGVEIELARPLTSGSVDLESVNGGVSLSLPGESKATISARCVNGGISVNNGLDVAVTGERSRRRFDGTLNGGGARVTLETTNGGVRISRATT